MVRGLRFGQWCAVSHSRLASSTIRDSYEARIGLLERDAIEFGVIENSDDGHSRKLSAKLLSLNFCSITIIQPCDSCVTFGARTRVRSAGTTVVSDGGPFPHDFQARMRWFRGNRFQNANRIDLKMSATRRSRERPRLSRDDPLRPRHRPGEGTVRRRAARADHGQRQANPVVVCLTIVRHAPQWFGSTHSTTPARWGV